MADQMNALAVQVLTWVAVVILSVLGGFATRLLHRMSQRAKSDTEANIWDRLAVVAQTVVQEMEQTVVASAKAAPTAIDATIRIKQAAIASFKNHLGPKGIAELQGIVGPSIPKVEQVLSSFIESKVFESKQPTTAIKLVPPPIGKGA